MALFDLGVKQIPNPMDLEMTSLTALKQEELRSAFFNETDVAFLLFDHDLNLVDANEGLLRTLHCKREDIIGKNIIEISPDIKTSGRYDLYKKVILTGES